jgi:hypothetical protein
MDQNKKTTYWQVCIKPGPNSNSIVLHTASTKHQAVHAFWEFQQMFPNHELTLRRTVTQVLDPSDFSSARVSNNGHKVPYMGISGDFDAN